MRVLVSMPKDWGRSYLGRGKFVKSAPVFDVTAFDDNGNRINDMFPSKVPFGPGMYDLLYKHLPSVASNLNEDITYEGFVPRRNKTKDRYAYYGYGNTPDNGGVKENTQGIGIIGYGDTELPENMAQFGYDYAGNPNYKYSELMDVAPNFSDRNSDILTNILNDSRDFSPLLAPLYPYEDPTYDPRINDEKIPLKERMKYARDAMAKRKGLEAFDYDPTSVEGNSADSMSVTDAGKVFIDPDTRGLSFPVTSTALLDDGEGRSAGTSNMAPKAVISGVSPKTAGDTKTVYGKRDNAVGRFGDLNTVDIPDEDVVKFMADYYASPTDNWVPRLDPVTREIIRDENGRMKKMPAPLTMGMPIYNFNHPMWQEDPEAAWNMVNDFQSAMNWDRFGTAPKFAEYDGTTSMTPGGKIRVMDYPLAIRKQAEKEGYFPEFAMLGNNYDKLRDYMSGKKQASRAEERQKIADAGFKDTLRKRFRAEEDTARRNTAANIFAPDDKSLKHGDGSNMTRDELRKRYRSLVHNYFRDTDKSELNKLGLDTDEEKALQQYVTNTANTRDKGDKDILTKYNALPENEKMAAIVKDYVQWRTDSNRGKAEEKKAAATSEDKRAREQDKDNRFKDSYATRQHENREREYGELFGEQRMHDDKQNMYNKLFGSNDKKKVYVVKRNGDVKTLEEKPDDKATVGKTDSKVNRWRSKLSRSLGGQSSADAGRLNPNFIDIVSGMGRNNEKD